MIRLQCKRSEVKGLKPTATLLFPGTRHFNPHCTYVYLSTLCLFLLFMNEKMFNGTFDTSIQINMGTTLGT